MATLLFDLDGSLIDSLPDLQAAVNGFYATHGVPPVDRATAQRFVGSGIDALTARALAHAGLTDIPQGQAKTAILAQYDAHDHASTRLYPGTLDALLALKAAGHTLGLCTNKPEAPARAVCDKLGLTACFAAIVGGDTLPTRKPDPTPYHHTLALCGGTLAESLYVGDSEIDHATARAAGVPFVWFSQGYLNDRPADFAPDATIDQFRDLPAAIARLLTGDA